MQRFTHFAKLFIYFLSGAISTGLVLISSAYLIFSFHFRDKVFPGVKINHWVVSSLTQDQVEKLLNSTISSINQPGLLINLSHPVATTSATASQIGLRFDNALTAKRAFSIGRQTPNPYWNFLQVVAAWRGNINLPLESTFDEIAVNRQIDTVAPKIETAPIDAVFKFEPGAGPDGKGRVAAYVPSLPGLAIDRTKLKETLTTRFLDESLRSLASTQSAKILTVTIPTKIVPPAISSSTADEMGIKNLLGEGISFFYDSIPNRVYNIGLGTQKVNGSLVAPQEIFSFDNAIGTISAIFGFQKAYVIKEGKTVLDDGGGVCQVSTTLYRAVLQAGLPIIERTAHTYRVGFYEQGGYLPGLDATVFPPNPDFKFKNDTGGYLLIQSTIDYNRSRLSFDIFGTDDGRKTTILGPYILSTSPPPEPVYEDDPTLQAGQIKQVDQAHSGAKVYFKRIVTRMTSDQSPVNLIDETIYSDYIPWPARFLKGTKTM